MAAEQNDDKSEKNDTIPSTVEASIENTDDKTATVDIAEECETSAIVNNNNESIANNVSDTKINGSSVVVGVNASPAVKNKKKNKKGKSGASNENGINKDETEECEVQGDTAVQV